MESSSRRHHHHQRSRNARGPPLLPPHSHPGHHTRQPPTRPRRNPRNSPAAAHPEFPMDDDAISTLMDIDDSPLNGAGFLDEEDGDGELFVGPSRGARGGDHVRGPLPFTDFFNSFDGADFDDADLG